MKTDFAKLDKQQVENWERACTMYASRPRNYSISQLASIGLWDQYANTMSEFYYRPVKGEKAQFRDVLNSTREANEHLASFNSDKGNDLMLFLDNIN